MFDDYWELIPRSQDSAGKSVVKSTYQRNSNYREIYSEILKYQMPEHAKRRHPGELGGPLATLGRGPRWDRAELWRGHLGPPPRLPLRVYLPPGKPN